MDVKGGEEWNTMNQKDKRLTQKSAAQRKNNKVPWMPRIKINVQIDSLWKFASFPKAELFSYIDLIRT